MSSAYILELRAKRAKLVSDANAITAKAADEKRSMTAEEAEKWDAMHADIEASAKDIERLETQESLNRSIEQPKDNRVIADPVDGGRADEPTAEHRNLAFNAWLRRGFTGMDDEQRALMQSIYAAELRDQSSGTTTTGGYTVAPDTSMYAAIVESLKAYGVDEAMFDVVNSATGASLPIPTNDDTANAAALVAENADSGSATDITFGQITVSAYTYGTGVLKASNQFLQDTSVDAVSFIGRKLGERVARKKAALLTTGTGSSQPQGIVTGAASGVTAASATAITYNELLDLQHSVDPAYRQSPSCGYMFNDSTLKAIKKLVDGQSRPLWLPGTASREPDTINGYSYLINQNMASIAASNKSVLFGDMKKFLVRNVQGFAVQRLIERYAEFNQVGFVGFFRFDSKMLDSGAIKYLVQAAS